MIPVILSGGNGSRLWPLSRQLHPKQFLPLVGEKTMFQQTLERLSLEGAREPVIVCNSSHQFIVSEQLDSIGVKPHSILLEPFGRNTAPAVALAAFSILEKGENEIMIVLPADHVIEDEPAFHEALLTAKSSAENGELVLFGITPLQPETGYGYIKASEIKADSAVMSVDEFVEKPDAETAAKYLASGNYYWNSGMFVFQAQRYLDELKIHAPDIYKISLSAYSRSKKESEIIHIDPEIFAHCPDDSIDYAVMEKAKDASLVPLDANWSDVGSWSALWDVHQKDSSGNVLKGDVIQLNSSNCYVHSNDKMVSLIGMDNVVVVETKDAVMIAHKDNVQDVKNVVNELKRQGRNETVAHREVYRPWGSYDSVDNGQRFQVKRITVKPGAQLSLQKHHHRAEHWIVVSGTAEVTCGEKVMLLTENQSTYIPVGEVHRLANPGKIPLEIIEVQSGSYLGEDDIERFEDVYGRADSIPADDFDKVAVR